MNHKFDAPVNTTLCETFRSLAFRTFEQLGRARRVGHQPLEETFTDLNILELKDRHPTEIYCESFTKRQEGINGADWEWWLTNASKSQWLGLRVQAKVLNLRSNTFPHLHYKSGKSRGNQATKLKRECAKDGLVPLYCFYLHDQPLSLRTGLRCGTFGSTAESYGCSLATLSHVESLRKAGEVNDLVAVIGGALPWHCLVCCSGYGGQTLPERAWALLQGAMSVTAPRRRSRTGNEAELSRAGIRDNAPIYVQAIASGRRPDIGPNNIGGVLVIRGTEND